jgi:hypothetical protein
MLIITNCITPYVIHNNLNRLDNFNFSNYLIYEGFSFNTYRSDKLVRNNFCAISLYKLILLNDARSPDITTLTN